jgi:hypothetical protein
MANDPLTKEELVKWLTPAQALRLVQEAWGGETAAANIVGRLKGGQVISGAKSSALEVKNTPVKQAEIVLIPTEHWLYWKENNVSGDLWGIGDVRIFLGYQAQPTVGLRNAPAGQQRSVITAFASRRPAFTPWLPTLRPE